MKPRLTDVATLLASRIKLSCACEREPRVKPETRRRVRAAMDELGYLPNSTAGALLRVGPRRLARFATTERCMAAATLLGLEGEGTARRATVHIVSVKALDSDQ